MSLDNMTIREFVDELASNKPTPGGGSAAALAGAMSAGLVSMVAKISQDRKIAEKSERLGSVLAGLIDEDAKAYEGVILAYQLPKGTEEEKRERIEAIERALRRAAEIPLQTARYSYEILKLAEVLLPKTKPGLITDIGTASSLAEASIQSALLNVRINLASTKEEEFKKEINKGIGKIADYFVRARKIFQLVLKELSK